MKKALLALLFSLALITPALAVEKQACRRYSGAASTPAVGPLDKTGSSVVLVSIRKIKGTGTVGTYQVQGADVIDGTYTDEGSPVSTLGTTGIASPRAFAKVAVTARPQIGTMVKVCITPFEEAPSGITIVTVTTTSTSTTSTTTTSTSTTSTTTTSTTSTTSTSTSTSTTTTTSSTTTTTTLQVQGGPCSGDGDCNAQFCVDGVCCNTTCTGTCRSCLAADTGGTDGTCDNITNLTDPHNECNGQGGVQSCNGAGACGPYCGDNNFDPGAPFNEQCDPGPFNAYPVTCCNADCTFTTGGSSCTDSGGTECDGAGNCVTTTTTTSTTTTTTTSTTTTTLPNDGFCDPGENCTWHIICPGGTQALCFQTGSDTTSPCSDDTDCAPGEYCLVAGGLGAESCGQPSNSFCGSPCTAPGAFTPNPFPSTTTTTSSTTTTT